MMIEENEPSHLCHQLLKDIQQWTVQNVAGYSLYQHYIIHRDMYISRCGHRQSDSYQTYYIM